MNRFIIIVFLMIVYIEAGVCADIVTITEQANKSVVLITLYDGEENKIATGSGFAIQQGLIATCCHVISGAVTATVKTQDKIIYPVDGVVAYDIKKDIAIIRVKRLKDIPILKLADSSLCKPGENVIALGSPRGLEGSVSTGIISANRTNTDKGDILQITSPVSPGNSGGPLLNDFGDVIGIISFSRIDGQNLNFGIQSNEINLLLKSAKDKDVNLSDLVKDSSLLTEYGILPKKDLSLKFQIPKKMPYSLAPFIGVRYIPESIKITTLIEKKNEKGKRVKETVELVKVATELELKEGFYFITESGALKVDSTYKGKDVDISFQYYPQRVAIYFAKNNTGETASKLLVDKLSLQGYEVVCGPEVDASVIKNSTSACLKIAKELNVSKLYAVYVDHEYTNTLASYINTTVKITIIDVNADKVIMENKGHHLEGQVGWGAKLDGYHVSSTPIKECYDEILGSDLLQKK